MLKYSQVQNLPPGHPLLERFHAEVDAYEAQLANSNEHNDLCDEESLAYFNRYVAGDR